MTTLQSPRGESHLGRERSEPSEPEVAIKEARRRQRRRWMAGGTLVLAVAVGASVAFVELEGGGTRVYESAQPQSPSGLHAVGAVLHAPAACGLLSNTEATRFLGSPASGRAFTDLGFPVAPGAQPNPTYSQCRYRAASQSELRLTINTSAASAPSVPQEAIAARGQPGDRVLTIDGALTVWMPWTQQNLLGQGGVLSSTHNGDYVSVDLIYVHRDPLSVAERVMRTLIQRLR